MTGGIALDENSFTHFGNFSETTQPIFNRRHLTGKKKKVVQLIRQQNRVLAISNSRGAPNLRTSRTTEGRGDGSPGSGHLWPTGARPGLLWLDEGWSGWPGENKETKLLPGLFSKVEFRNHKFGGGVCRESLRHFPVSSLSSDKENAWVMCISEFLARRK